jgi:hypothetical protein
LYLIHEEQSVILLIHIWETPFRSDAARVKEIAGDFVYVASPLIIIDPAGSPKAAQGKRKTEPITRINELIIIDFIAFILISPPVIFQLQLNYSPLFFHTAQA